MNATNLSQFSAERERLRNLMLSYAGRDMKRLLTLDNAIYEEGALSNRTKELLALVASTVLRCEDCISYHLLACHKHGLTTAELMEAFTIAMLIGGSTTMPQLRRAIAAWDQLEH